jgi:hypothetical protein
MTSLYLLVGIIAIGLSSIPFVTYDYRMTITIDFPWVQEALQTTEGKAYWDEENTIILATGIGLASFGFMVLIGGLIKTGVW